jgi:HlyD family secretion protein
MTTRTALAAMILIATTGLTACGEKKDKAAPKAPAAALARTVSIGSVETRPLGGGVEASGLLVSREEAAVGSELSGYRVARLYADEGDYVRAGQPLAQLDDTLLRAQVEQQAAVTAQS